MRGHIRRRNERWQAQVYIGLGADGRRKYRSRTFTKKHDAESWLREQINLIESNTYTDIGDMTLAQWLGKWLDTYCEPRLARSTTDGYRIIVMRHLVPGLGHIRLSKLRAHHIQGYYADKSETLSARTVLHHHACLRKGLRDAIRAGYLSANPAVNVAAPHPETSAIRPYTPGELQRILTAARSTSYYLAVAIGVYTGMRRGEVCGLLWGDLDMEGRRVHVQRSMDQGGRLKPPKTDRSRRTIPIPAVMVDDLRAEYFADVPDDAPVFVLPDGSQVTPSKLSHMFTYIRKRAGIAHGCYHTLRHTFATVLLRKGTHPKVVQELLGHSTINTTLDVYSHVMLPQLSEAVDLFTDVLADGSERLLGGDLMG